MRSVVLLLTAILVAIVAPVTSALADGGQVRVSEQRGRYRITVFTSPNPLRAGEVDVSVLVQADATSGVVTDARVIVELSPSGGGRQPIRAVATGTAATNKLLHAALVSLPSAGRWEASVSVTVGSDEAPMVTTFVMDAGPPLPPWLSVWPWFSWPLLIVVLFIMHRWLVARRAGKRGNPQCINRFYRPTARDGSRGRPSLDRCPT